MVHEHDLSILAVPEMSQLPLLEPDPAAKYNVLLINGEYEGVIPGYVERLDRAPMTLYAHVEESIQYPKAITYLTQVDEKAGPTSCYPHALDKLGLNPLQELVGRVVGNVGNGVASTLRTAYGRNSLGQSCLMARRLVERGVDPLR